MVFSSANNGREINNIIRLKTSQSDPLTALDLFAVSVARAIVLLERCKFSIGRQYVLYLLEMSRFGKHYVISLVLYTSTAIVYCNIPG